MDKTCPVCGENAVIEDRSGEQCLTVCGECGSVLSELNLIVDWVTLPEVGYQHDSRSIDNLYSIAPKFTQVREERREGKTMGIKHAKIVCEKLKYPKEMTDYVCYLYCEVLQHKEIYDKSLENKQVISLACIYIVGRTHDRPITLKEFCGICKVSVYKVATFVKTVLRLQNITLPYQSIGSLTAHILSRANLEYLLECVLEILQICDKLWLSTGRHRDMIITAATYFAWVSKDIMQNKSVSLRSFCQQFKFVYGDTIRERFKEMKETLAILTNNLPWACHKGRKDFVFVNLVDTLKYQKSLIYSSSSSLFFNDSDETSDESYDKKDLRSVRSHKRPHDSPGKENSIFLPPSFKMSKGEKETVSELCESNNDNVISDSEEFDELIERDLDKYIRTEEEVKEMVKIQSLNQ